MPILTAERTMARVCCRPLAGVVSSNPAGFMDVCVVCCKYRQKAKSRTIKTKNQVGMTYIQSTREYKKKKSRQANDCVSCQVQFSARDDCGVSFCVIYKPQE